MKKIIFTLVVLSVFSGTAADAQEADPTFNGLAAILRCNTTPIMFGCGADKCAPVPLQSGDGIHIPGFWLNLRQKWMAPTSDGFGDVQVDPRTGALPPASLPWRTLRRVTWSKGARY
jgi:hypothetical protein